MSDLQRLASEVVTSCADYAASGYDPTRRPRANGFSRALWRHIVDESASPDPRAIDDAQRRLGLVTRHGAPLFRLRGQRDNASGFPAELAPARPWVELRERLAASVTDDGRAVAACGACGDIGWEHWACDNCARGTYGGDWI